MPPAFLTESELSIDISTALFSSSAVMKAAHRLTGECSFEFIEDKEGRITVKLYPKNSASPLDCKGRFLNELLDEELRERIAKETHAERALIMAHALSRHPVINQDLHSAPAFPHPWQQSTAP